MREPVTLDQLKVFVTCVERGSFSAAARALQRSQSMVSESIAQLERDTGVSLFDRSGRFPRLTDAGQALLIEARAVGRSIDAFRARARGLAQGLEHELSVAIDALYPMEWLTRAVGEFREQFPDTLLRMQMDVMGAVLQPVLDGQCQLAVAGPLPAAMGLPDRLASEPLLQVAAVTVAAPTHPLAAVAGTIPRSVTEQHVQLVVTDRSGMTAGRDHNVLSPLTWRVADMNTKLAFLRAGFGWGHMPLPQVEDDLTRGALQTIRVEGFPFESPHFPLRAVYLKDTLPGPAARWLLSRLRQPAAALAA